MSKHYTKGAPGWRKAIGRTSKEPTETVRNVVSEPAELRKHEDPRRKVAGRHRPAR